MKIDYLLALLVSLAIFLACREGIFTSIAEDTQYQWWLEHIASDELLEYLDEVEARENPPVRIWPDEGPLVDDIAIPEIYTSV